MKRFSFLDWMRGLAVILMIQCHTFNSFVQVDLRQSGPYVLSMSLGGMAAPLFLFMAGMTLGFQMDSLERRENSRLRRWLISLRRAGYIWGIAYLFRFTNWGAGWPHSGMEELTKVDILNCMGLGMTVLAAVAMFPSHTRLRIGLGAGLVIAGFAPVVANLDWSGAPAWLHEYLAPGPWRGRFAFFPCASYIAFGLAAGTLVKGTPGERLDRFMQWSALAGLALVFTAQYFGNSPYSIYEKSDFWRNSPALILIRVGIAMVLMSASYLWTESCATGRWNWVQALGKTSLMAYWVHIMIVYGSILQPLKQALTISQAVLATVAVTGLMVALAAGKLWWTGGHRLSWPLGASAIAGSSQPGERAKTKTAGLL